MGKRKLKHVAQQIFPAPYDTIITQLLKTNLLSETIVSQTQTAFICSNSGVITCKIYSKLTIEAPDIVLMSITLTANI